MKLIILLFALVTGFNYALKDAVKGIRYPKESNLYVIQTEPMPQVTFANENTEDALPKSEKNNLKF